MADLQSILTDPNYTEANVETKQAIFDKYSANDSDYQNANEDTKAQIRKVYGLEDVAIGSQLQIDIDRLNEQDKVVEENVKTGLKTTMAAVSPYATQKAYSKPLNWKQTGQAVKSIGITRPLAEIVGTAVTGVPGTSYLVEKIPGVGKLGPSIPETLKAGKQILGTGANLAIRGLGPVGMAATAYDAYDVMTDPDATATDYIPPAVGAVASAPLAYKAAQKAISPSVAVAKAEEAAAKARGAQIANIGRKFALNKIIPGMASKVLGPVSAVGGMVVPSASESDYKYQFPITGPARGSEINQQTGRPWTREELDAYYVQYPEEPGVMDRVTSFISEQFK